MTIEDKRHFNIQRVAVLYRDLLSSSMHPLNDNDKSILLKIKPKNKIVAIGDIDLSNWNTYALTYLLDRKLVVPTVLDESKIYQTIHAMRTHDETIVHPQTLISESVVIRIIGFDNSTNINDYINTFINMCIASDECKLIFIIIDGDKRFYKNSIYVRKTNSTFIETSSGKPYIVESSPLCIDPDDIVFFNYSKKTKPKQSNTIITNTSSSISIKNNKPSMSDYEFF